MIAQILYTSVSTYARGDISDLDILRSALRRNPAMNITGFLFRTNNHFIQFIEGSESALDSVMEKIRADQRHAKIKEWPMELAAKRAFPDWTMGYGDTLGDDCVARTTHHTAKRLNFDQMRDYVVDLARPFHDQQELIWQRL